MAQQGSLTDLEELSCFICSGLLKEPVDILCGHSFCMSCMSKHWDQESREEKLYSCPTCKSKFSKPRLVKNITLASLVEQHKKIAVVHQVDTEVQGVACDMCTERKRRASKSCLQCLVSYCEEHLQPHYGVPALKRHKLMEPIENLQENICSQHNQVESVFCQTCQKCICNLCQLDEHTGHNTVPADITKRQTELQTKQHTAQQRVRALEKNIDLLNQELRAINQSADKVVSETENKLRKLIEQKSRNLTEKIKKQQQLEVSRVQGLLKKLQEELAVERERNAELKEVATIKSYTEFLQRCSSVSAKWTHHNPPNIPVIPDRPSPLMYFEQVSMAVSELNRTCIKDFKKLVQAVTEVDVLLPPNPQSNEEFLHYSFQLTLNPNTANKTLVLSEKNTKVSSMKEEQHYPPHPDRFMDKAQVLSMNPLPPRCYWEVEWTGLSFYVGVAYKDIKREGPKSAFGSNDNCWVLECQNKRNYVFKHNGKCKYLLPCETNRVGVFLDHKAGILRFYQVSETNKLIHKVKTRFTQPLYAGVGLYFFSVTAKMCFKEVRGS